MLSRAAAEVLSQRKEPYSASVATRLLSAAAAVFATIAITAGVIAGLVAQTI